MLIYSTLVLITQVTFIITFPTLVYHNEISEYCRKQVMPSIFLSKQVAKTNSHILHFSKLELPYTCYISVRTESGNNFILVSELLAQHDLNETCSKNPNQLTIYETGETFGGYWGPLANDLMYQGAPATTKYYTLKTTASTLPQITDGNITIKQNQKTSTTLEPIDALTNEEFITLEIPLVNVSGSFIHGQNKEMKNKEAEDLFKVLYNITPWPSIKYDADVLPLVQFGSNRRTTSQSWNPDRKILPTPDIRLTYPEVSYRTAKRIPWQRQKYNANRRLHFKKNNLFFKYRKNNTIFHKHRPTSIARNFLNRNYKMEYTPVQNNNKKKYAAALTTTKERNLLSNNVSWKLIMNLMKTLNKSVYFEVTTLTNFPNILNITSKTKPNFSAYLVSNLSTYDNNTWDERTSSPERIFNYNKTSLSQTYRPHKVVNTISSKELFTKNSSPRNIITNVDITSTDLNKTLKMSSDQIIASHVRNKISIRNNLQKKNSEFAYSTRFRKVFNSYRTIFNGDNVTTASKVSKITTAERASFDRSYFSRTPKLSGSLVDHESWENIVQSAPEMAVLLNETRDDDSGHVNKTKRRHKKRKRRTINAIAIERNRPRSLTTKATVTTSEITFNIADMQEFAQLVELKDDELHDRVALRDMTKFSGPILYNICDSQDVAGRGVFLFNASRIVLFINNFSLQGLTVVLTPARTLLTGTSYCSSSNIECQVSGTRVCIDALATCDGIPNCGSYDIYDEDPLLCGGSSGMIHNVYLAAFTFLALIFTLFYVVHYWLRQYVPKVSEAFFIYINGTENILYLDSIMRNPNQSEDDDISKLYDGNLFKDDILCSTDIKTNKMTFLKLVKKIFRKKRTVPDDIFLSSFPETELRYIQKQEVAETAVQTGESLEIAHFPFLKDKLKNFSHSKLILPVISETYCRSPMMMMDSTSHIEDHVDELSILKFFKKSRSDSIHSVSFDISKQAKDICAKSSVTTLEKEIVIHEYDQPPPEIAGPSTRHESLSEIRHIQKSTKQLRFDEEITIITSMEFGERENDSSDDYSYRRVVDLGKRKGPISNKINYNNTGGRSFWGKSQKQKKRT